MRASTYLIGKVIRGNIAVTVLMALTATLSTVINGLVVGQMLGSDALTAFGLASPMFILLGAVAGVFSSGGSIRCAKHMGAGDMHLVRVNFTAAVAASVISAVAYGVVCVVFADSLASALGATGDMAGMTADYIRGLGVSAAPFLLLQCILNYLRMDNGQRISLVSMVVVIVVNTMYAVYSCSFTDSGLFGIGLAILTGNVVGLVVVVPHFLRRDRMIGLASLRGAGGELRDICMSGLPTAINRGSQTLKNLVLNSFLLGFGGTVAVLALSVQTSVYQFLIAISTGYGLMIAMVCGMFFGEKDRGSIIDTLRVTVKSGVVVSAVVAVVLFVFAEPVASMFIKDGGDLALATRCLRIFAFSVPTSTLCLCLLYMYQTMGNLLLSNIVSLTRGALYVIMFSLLLAPVFGLDGVWASFALADVLSVLTIMAVIWRRTGKVPFRAADFVIAREGSFDVDVVYEASIRNDMSEVEGLTGRISEACTAKGVPEDKANRVSLCIEEMAGNVVQHAFEDGREHFIDIRVVVCGGDVIFRMRDDGVRFNPLVADTEGHLGIKVVRAAAKSIDYRYTVKLNNLTVTV